MQNEPDRGSAFEGENDGGEASNGDDGGWTKIDQSTAADNNNNSNNIATTEAQIIVPSLEKNKPQKKGTKRNKHNTEIESSDHLPSRKPAAKKYEKSNHDHDHQSTTDSETTVDEEMLDDVSKKMSQASLDDHLSITEDDVSS